MFSPRRPTITLWGLTLAANIVALVVQGMSATVVVTTPMGIVALLFLSVARRRRLVPCRLRARRLRRRPSP